MRPSKAQIKVTDEVIKIIHTWINTNDIDSPTHHSDINEELWKLEDDGVITSERQTSLTLRMRDLLTEIQSL